MKDLIEVRLTVAAKQLDGRALKALKPAAKLAEPFLLRLAETLTSFVENEVKANQTPTEENPNE